MVLRTRPQIESTCDLLDDVPPLMMEHALSRTCANTLRVQLALLVWKLLAIGAARAGLPKRCLACASALVHFASFGDLLPWPLRRKPFNLLVYTWEGSRSPTAWLPVDNDQAQAALATAWFYYACVPFFLPRRFPHELPLEARYAMIVSIGVATYFRISICATARMLY